ncbi:hypothetical protein Tco_0516707 [Tanacetum coccineum]
MLTMAENVIVAGADNRPPILDKTQFSLWASRMILYIKGRIRTYDELTNAEKIREACDIKETNIDLQGLPQDIYNQMNHDKEAKDIWDRVKLLTECSKISLQERDSKLYDEFDTFTSVPGETIHSYYLSKLEADVKLAKYFHNMNFDHLYGYLRQHKAHANEATIQDGRVTVQTVQGRQTQGYTGSGVRSNAIGFNRNAGNNTTCQAKKMLLVEALESGVMLDEEHMAFLADNRDTVTTGQASLELDTTAAFQANDLDAFDSDCDEAPSASAILMAKISAYD